jgi:hypothetical protein
MSANGAFTSTLDFDFIGGGYLTIQGGAAGTIDPVLSSTSKVFIVGQSSNNFISYDIVSGAQMPPASGRLEYTLDFTVSATVEFGVQRWATANTRIEFTLDTVPAYNLTHSYLNKTLTFTLESLADQFSLGELTVSAFDYSFSGKAVNVSTHVYDIKGLNNVQFRDNYNTVSLLEHINDIQLVDNGSTDVRILSPA